MNKVLAFLVVLGTATSNHPKAKTSDWKEYRVDESGFTVALPTKPETRVLPLPMRDGSLRIYESMESRIPPTKYSIFVGLPEQQGIYEPASMDAYLDNHTKSLMQVAEGAKLQFSRRIIFRGLPGLEYQFSHKVEGVQYLARGVTFMIDGGHMRVSMWHPANDRDADANYKHLVESFQLRPIAYRAADKPFTDSRGVTFSPPERWIQKPSQNPVQVARFDNLTRSMQLLIAANATYTCKNFHAEIQASGRLKSTTTAQLGSQQFAKLMTFENVPKYQVRLTTVQYCLNSRHGAVVLTGSEEESMFPRWEKVFEGTAATVRAQ